MCLSWAAQNPVFSENSVVVDCLQLVEFIEFFDYEVIHKLSFVFFKALVFKEDAKVNFLRSFYGKISQKVCHMTLFYK